MSENIEIDPLVVVGRDDDKNVIVSLYESASKLDPFEFGIMLVDVMRNARDAFGWIVDDIMEGVEAEVDSPTDQPVEISSH